MIALILEAAGPALFFALLVVFAVVWHTLQQKASKSDCQDCGAPGPYSQHPGICWGCIQERQAAQRACDCFDDLPYRSMD